MDEIILTKTVGESRCVQTQIVMSAHDNGSGMLFGGQLMCWIDIVGGVAARRHSGRSVITASVDNLEFRGSAHVGDIIELVGQLTYVGTTSMEVRVDTFVESNGEKNLVNRAYLIFVALDEHEHPVRVPRLSCSDAAEAAEYAAGEARYRLRRARRESEK